MKYSLALALCVASLVLQCSCRPQGLPETPETPDVTEASSTLAPPASSSPAAETILSEVDTPTEVPNAGEVIFDDAPASGSGGQDDSDSTAVTTDMPAARSEEEMEADDTPATTMTPEMVMEEVAEPINTDTSGDASAAPSSDDDDADAGTTQAPSTSSD